MRVELVQHRLDLDRCDCCAMERRHEHAAQRIAERQAETALERLVDEGRLALAVATCLADTSDGLQSSMSAQGGLMLIVQDPSKPGAMRNAIVDLLATDLRTIRIASAYVTLEGSIIIRDAVERLVGRPAMDAMEKMIIASLDYGITEPQALDMWRRLPNTTLLVAGADAVARGSLQPVFSAFHPKVYAFERQGGRSNVLVGSANMTSRGLSANTEAAAALRDVPRAQVMRAIAAVREQARPLDDALLASYESLRRRLPAPRQARLEIEPLPAPPQAPLGTLPYFGDEIAAGRLQPQLERHMWIQAARTEGGSANQVEMARGSNRFFGFDYAAYADEHVVIGYPRLFSGRREWTDRPLTWHGAPKQNRMERINMPTLTQGGFDYAHSAILFQRKPNDRFEVVVAAWDSDLAKSWRAASAYAGKTYRVGSSATRARLTGFF